MARRSNRYHPGHDDPYISREAYPDPYAGLNDNAYEYIGPDATPDPPSHTFEDGPSSSRRRSPLRRHRSSRASTLPPRSSANPSPPRPRRRGESPPPRSSRHSDSPPRRRHSRRERDASPPPRLSKTAPPPPPAAAAAGAGAGAGAGAKAAGTAPSGGGFKDRYGRWLERPAIKNMNKNMKTYGSKGLRTMGDIVEAYAAAQAGGAAAGATRGRRDPYANDYYDDPYGRSSHRSRRYRSPSTSPSPSRHSTGIRSHRNRDRLPMHGRQKSYSLSPAPRRRGYDTEEDDRQHRRRSRRHSPTPSPSPTRSRRGRARSHSHGRESAEPSTRRSKSGHPHMQHYRNEMKSPNPDVAHRWQLAARAALEAGGVTAFRLRKEPGSWTGQKGAKVVTAALGAAAIDSFIDKDPRRTKQGGVKGMAESVVGGLLASKLMGFPAGSTHKGKPRRY